MMMMMMLMTMDAGMKHDEMVKGEEGMEEEAPKGVSQGRRRIY